MKQAWPLALASLLLLEPTIRAEFIPWDSWITDQGPSGIGDSHAYAANGSDAGHVYSFLMRLPSGTGSMNNIPLIKFLSTGSSTATLQTMWYDLYIGIHDRQSDQIGSFHFGGSIGGNIYNLSNKNVSNTFSDPV